MKRVLSLMICAVMLLGALAGCTTIEEGTKGMIIDVYMTREMVDFDPALHFNDDAMVQVFDLIFEGLTDLDENGKWKKALMKEYELLGNDDDGWYMLITLKNTKWTDGRTVQAADFVYAWKRILNATFKSEAAALLYDITNARDVKMGDVSIDDVGISAVDVYVLQVNFDKKPDVDRFFTAVSSPALVPLREDIVERDAHWAKQASGIVTNGPFAIKSLTKGEVMRLERSGYYYLDDEKNEALDKYVIPYRLVTNYSYGDAAAQLEKFEAGELFYLDEIPLAFREQYKNEAVITDELATHTYYFNTNNKLFSDARVRRALSMAIDRNEIVKIVTYAKAATGLIPYNAFETSVGTSFREIGGDVIAAAADVAGAKALLGEAGVKGGSFTITVRNDEADLAVAAYVKGVWESLGFKVTVEEVAPAKIKGTDKNIYSEAITERYQSGDFDVIALDLQMLAPDAFVALAPFAAEFSGNGVNMDSSTYDVYGHATGYKNDAYDALIEKAYAAANAADRAAALHEAETMLMADMPVMPLIFLQDAFLIHDDLSGYGSSYYASREFKQMKLKNYTAYLPEED
ncbi:MAG: hypothetical protein IKB87_00295 [Clostridia bacterium]|nr:hypothetical protein [Clostridia bacterium]